jgi:NAD(P)-dependent dehydrogenase (short-subunit alcohol dehydrogenase family)
VSLDTSPVPDYPSLLRLDGRGLVVLGAGQGMGRQASHALASAGAKVLCADLDAARAAHVAAEIEGIPWSGDVTVREEVARLADFADDALGGVDGFVDIVGMARYGPLLEVSDEDWDWAFDMSVRHAFLAAQEVGARMAEGATMVFIASASALTAAPGHAPYGAAKAALASLVRSLAVELGPRGIRANAVAPGVVWTPRVSELLGDAGHEAHAANAPLGRVAQPSDIASVVLFLSSGLSAYMTGQTLVVDGGVGQKFPYPILF